METDEAVHCDLRSVEMGMSPDGDSDGVNSDAIERFLRGDVAIVVISSRDGAAEDDATDAETQISSMFFQSSSLLDRDAQRAVNTGLF